MIDVAIDAAKQAGDLALKYYKSQPKVTYKPDKSPVTRADVEVEKLIRKIISKKFPDHGFVGEETPDEKPNAKYKWIIDPIDGTRDFVRQLPYWCSLVCVLENNQPTVAVAYFPFFDELFAAEKNKGCYLNGHKSKVSNVNRLQFAYLTHSSAHHFLRHNKVNQFIKLSQLVGGSRNVSSYGIDLLLKGKADIYLAARGGIWDFAAPSLLVEEAGGKYSDFDSAEKLTSDNFVATNGLLHEQVLKVLNEGYTFPHST